VENLELRLEEQRKRIAASIPGYLGYRERERRRDADRELRADLARQYSAQQDRLTDLQRRATNRALLSALDDMERAGLKLQRFIDRLRTASYGYAGWFDTATIREAELEQLYAFDHLLTAGVERVAAALNGVAEAVDAREGVEAAVEGLAGTVDDLNRRFDQRRNLLAEGKKTPPNELKEALEVAALPSPAFQALADLKVDDALTYDSIDYLVIAKVTYDAQGALSYAYQLEDTDTDRWLRVGRSMRWCCSTSSMRRSPRRRLRRWRWPESRFGRRARARLRRTLRGLVAGAKGLPSTGCTPRTAEAGCGSRNGVTPCVSSAVSP